MRVFIFVQVDNRDAEENIQEWQKQEVSIAVLAVDQIIYISIQQHHILHIFNKLHLDIHEADTVVDTAVVEIGQIDIQIPISHPDQDQRLAHPILCQVHQLMLQSIKVNSIGTHLHIQRIKIYES